MWKDLLYAVRMLGKNPGFTLVAVVSLAIGIGANSAVFSFADALLLRPLSVPKPNDVVVVNAGSSNLGDSSALSYPDYLDLRERNHTFAGLVAYQYGQLGYAPNRTATPELTFGIFVSDNFFSVLDIEPTLGRPFRPSEVKVAGRDPVVILSYDFWLARFHGSPSALGSKLRLNQTDFTVIGVAPATFTNIDLFVKPSVFLPTSAVWTLNASNSFSDREDSWVTVKGRLKPGITGSAAQADLNALFDALRPLHKKPTHHVLRVQSELALRVEQSPPDAALLKMLGILALCVLIVACANVAGLLLSRAIVRRREISVRLALGAARWQIIRQLCLENLLLALGGGLLGIGVGLAGIRLFASIPMPSDLPIMFDVTLDNRVLLFTLIVSVLSTFLFGVTPALRTSRADVITELKARDAVDSPGGRLWGRNLLVSAQLAISVVLLLVAAVIFQGFAGELNKGPGFRIDRLFLMSFDSKLQHYDTERNERFYQRLLREARSAPGVRSAALASGVPFAFGFSAKMVVPEGRVLRKNEQLPSMFNAVVTDGYFETLGIPITKGRGFLQTDKADTTRVAVINENLASSLWPGQDPLGKRFRLDNTSGPLLQVVGVAHQAKYLWIAEPPVGFFYLPFSQNQQSDMTLLTETVGSDATALAPTLRRVIHGIDPAMPTYDVRSLRDLFNKRAVQTTSVLVKTVFGLGMMALVLAAVGLYGLMAYSVSRRTREIGIRMALGADRIGVLQMILRKGLLLAGSGVLVGLLGGIAIARVLGSMLMSSFSQADPWLFAAITAILVLVSAFASFLPAQRASSIDPMSALREE